MAAKFYAAGVSVSIGSVWLAGTVADDRLDRRALSGGTGQSRFILPVGVKTIGNECFDLRLGIEQDAIVLQTEYAGGKMN